MLILGYFNVRFAPQGYESGFKLNKKTAFFRLLVTIGDRIVWLEFEFLGPPPHDPPLLS